MEILLEADGGAVEEIGITLPIVMSMWVRVGDLYYADLQHFLDTENYQIELFRNSTPKPIKVWVHKEQTLDSNTIRVFVTAGSDGRFEGKATIIEIKDS